MDLTILEPGAIADGDTARWRAMLADRRGSRTPFLTPTFTAVVGQHRRGTRVAVVRDGGRATAFLPFEWTPEHVGIPVGGHLNDVQAIVGTPPAGLDARSLVRAMGVRDWRFDHLLTGQRVFEPYQAGIHRSPVIDVSEGKDAYEASLRARSRNVLSQTRHMRNRLSRDHGPISLEWHRSSHELLDVLVRWKSAQYARTGVVDVLAPRWTRDTLHHFLEVTDTECAGLLSVLRAGDRVVALHFGLTSDSVLHYWFPVYDPDLAGYKPGMQLLLELARDAPEHGITLLDLGMGEQDYKLRVATGAYEVAHGQVPARGNAYRAVLLARHPEWARRRLGGLGRRLAARVSVRPVG